MKIRHTPARALLGLLAGAAGLLSGGPGHAQTIPWADLNYQYRRPLTVQNAAGTALAAGDISTYSYAPWYKELENTRRDGKDVKIYYYDGSQNVDVPQALLPMGASAAKILFSLQGPINGASFLTENLNSDKTDYASLPTGTRVTALDGKDDDATVVTIPFNFPFYNGSTKVSSNQLTIATDGFLKVGSTGYNPRPSNGLANAQSIACIMPFSSDYQVPSNSTGGVFVDATASRAVIRWEVEESGVGGTIIARFAAILYPNGDIRFVYGTPVNSTSAGVADPNTANSYWPVVYGVSNGDPGMADVHADAYPVSLTGHNDITYAQSLNLGTTTGYYVYYGNPGDDGKTGRTLPPSNKLVAYTFDDNTTQGWAPAGEGGTVAAANGLLILGATGSKGHPMAIAAGQTTDMGDQIIYARVRAPRGGHEIYFGGRGTADGAAYALGLDGYDGVFGISGGNAIISARTAPNGGTGDTAPLSWGNHFVINDGWAIGVLKIKGTGDAATMNSRYFLDGTADPGTWQLSANMSGKDVYNNAKSNRISDSGKLALFGWDGGGNHLGAQEIDYIYAAGPNAENATYAYGAEEQASAAGTGTIQGTVGIVTTPSAGGDINVKFVPTAGGETYSTATKWDGTYAKTLPPGTYNLTFTSYMGTATVSNVTVTAGTTQTADVMLNPTNLLQNGDLETRDPVFPDTKPAGWYRRDYGDATVPDPNPGAVTDPWIYDTTGANAHSGTSSVGFGGGAGLRGWDPEGSTPSQYNGDSLGLSPLAKTIPGGNYLVSAWMKRTDNSGNPRLRVRDMTSDNEADASLSGGGTTVGNVPGPTGGFQQISAYWVAASNFLSVRPYGDSIASGQFVYFDDISVTVDSLPDPVAPVPTFRGYVVDSNGNPMPGVAVAVSESTNPNVLADPTMSTTTDQLGRFVLSFTPDTTKTYLVEAWKDGNLASAPVVLNQTASTTIVYDTVGVGNAALGRPVVAYNGQSGSEPAVFINDGNTGRRWASAGNPGYVVIDLGKSVNFGTDIKQATIVWEFATADAYQIRVSDTAPVGLDATTAPTWGTPVFTSIPSGAATLNMSGPGGNPTDIITNFQPASGRYVMILMTAYRSGLGNYSVYEFKLEGTPGTATGTVVDETGAPVAGAAVTNTASGFAYATTDSNGKYTITNIAGLPFDLTAHKATSDASKVYPRAGVITVTPAAGTPATATPLLLPNVVDNLIPQAGQTSAYTNLAYDGTKDVNAKLADVPQITDINKQLPELTDDYDYTTRWETNQLWHPWEYVTDQNPVYCILDLGAAKTFNQVVIHWEAARASSYKLEATSTYDMSTNTPEDWGAPIYNGIAPQGYSAPVLDGSGAKVGDRYVDVISLPDAVTARYLRIRINGPGLASWPSGVFSIWEVQAANVPTAVYPPLSLATKALRIAGGLEPAQGTDNTLMNVVAPTTTGITVDDAIALAKQGR